jgi:hypothetical protein
MMSSSKKISLLKFVNLSIFTSIGLVSCYLIMLQNFLGLYLSRSGSSNCSFALWFLQQSLNFLYASFVLLLFFPYLRFVYLYEAFAHLHDSSNHGARCFAHLFGLILMFCLFLWLLTTPAVFASFIRNYSIFSVRRSFSSSYFYDIWLKAAANVSVDVCAFQIFALLLYSATQSPCIQWWSSSC